MTDAVREERYKLLRIAVEGYLGANFALDSLITELEAAERACAVWAERYDQLLARTVERERAEEATEAALSEYVPIVAALAIYGANANIGQLVVKARALNVAQQPTNTEETTPEAPTMCEHGLYDWMCKRCR